MRRIATRTLFLLALASIATVVVWAVSAHFKHGSPQISDGGLTLTIQGTLTGLGNGDLQINLGASANPTGQCCTPGGSCKVPGQNPAPVNVTASVAIPGSAIKNGNAFFSVTTNPPTTPIPGAPDCPNSGWDENITDMAFTSGSLQVLQSNGASPPVFSQVLSATISFAPPTADGVVPSTGFSITVGP